MLSVAGQLGRKNHRVVMDPTCSQLLADDPRKGAAFCFGNIGDAKLLRIQLVSGAESGDNGNTA